MQTFCLLSDAVDGQTVTQGNYSIGSLLSEIISAIAESPPLE